MEDSLGGTVEHNLMKIRIVEQRHAKKSLDLMEGYTYDLLRVKQPVASRVRKLEVRFLRNE